MKRTVKDLLENANSQITTYEVADAMKRHGEENVVFIDVRDEPELQDGGRIPGAVHASRGMLEFYIDPASPYHKEIFSSGVEIIFYCKSGGRSALAAQRAQEMGVERVANLKGGFPAWKEQGGPVES